jgi:peptide/nickel transport system permease protein
MVSPRTIRNLKRELNRSLLAKVGIAIVAFVLLMAVFAPFIAPYSPGQQNLEEARKPPLGFSTAETKEVTKTVNGSVVIGSDGTVETENRTVYENATLAHPLGTDGNGRDILSRVIYGARTSILVGVLGTSLAVLIGVTVGLSAGYYRGNVDDALMRAADIMLAFPSLVLAIALVGVWGQAKLSFPDPFVVSGAAGAFRDAVGLGGAMPTRVVLPGTVVVVVALVNWVWFARVSRGEALSLREESYIKAARSMGASDSYILTRHVLPNAATPILVLATIQIAAIILLESALSFLGFSAADVSWGFDIALGRQYQTTAWWIAAVPGMAIVLTVVGLNLVGDWLRDALDPGIEGEGGV